MSAGPFVHEQDYAESFQVILMNACKIMNYCYGKKLLNLGVDPTQNGQLPANLGL